MKKIHRMKISEDGLQLLRADRLLVGQVFTTRQDVEMIAKRWNEHDALLKCAEVLRLVVQRNGDAVSVFNATAVLNAYDEQANAEAHGRRSRTVQPLVGSSEVPK